uniref:Uncharacterized protein n=1 Tax=Brassica oleracea var. oleracea TaxID=109376 RepID=A0A0D3E996_BRAOL
MIRPRGVTLITANQFIPESLIRGYPDLSPTISPRPTGTGGSWRPNGNHVKSAVAGLRIRDGRHLSRGLEGLEKRVTIETSGSNNGRKLSK